MLSPSTTNVHARFCFAAFGRYPDCVEYMEFTVIREYSGQSGGETPVPIPNTEVKPVYVLYCTQVREPSGNTESCYAHLLLLIFCIIIIGF